MRGVLWVEVLGVRDPLEVTSEVILNLLLLTQLLKVAPRFGFFSLL